MATVTLEILVCPHCLPEVEALVGSNRLYRRGTDEGLLLACRDRAEADLLAVNLNLTPGVKARILGG